MANVPPNPNAYPYPPNTGGYPMAPGQYPPPGAPGAYPAPGPNGPYPPGAPGAYPPGGYPQNYYPPPGAYPPGPYQQPGPNPAYPAAPYQPYPAPAPGVPGQPLPGQPPVGPAVPGAPGTITTTTTSVSTAPATSQQQLYFVLPTMVYPVHNPDDDAYALKKAIVGLGTDEKGLIRVICNRERHNLLHIAKLYQEKTKESLVKAIKGDCSGNFCRLLVNLVRPIEEVKARAIKKATKGAGTHDRRLIDVLVFSTNAEIKYLVLQLDSSPGQ